jgi:succinate dehydrogenase/fumarate reductase flavoprotein subunit
MFNELLKETSQIKEEDLKPETQAIVMELVNVQKKIQSLETKLAEIKATKKELSQPVIDALHQLDLQNIRVGKVLVSLNKARQRHPLRQLWTQLRTS